MAKNIGILIFDEVEVLDFCGPFEVFSVTRNLRTSDDDEADKPFNVYLVAEQEALVRTRGGMMVQPHCTTATCPPLDLLLIPGGWGTRREVGNKPLITWIAQRSAEVELTASVCTGAFLLAAAGLLEGRRATTHWQSIARLAQTYPTVTVLSDIRYVDEGKIITSAGISAGIDMSLYLVQKWLGRAVAEQTARVMEYNSNSAFE
ncbi:MAG: AraC family transcriptional regulator [Candidatus Chloroheliales bacterium]|nr:MAG: AraC family transcriptional regulator [Chloroflexota bacterium]